MAGEYYKPGSFWRIDDRTGFKVRAEDTKKEWNGLIVEKRFWEPRQPQDLVKGRADNQKVPNPRPESTDVNIGPVTAGIAVLAVRGQFYIIVDSNEGFSVGLVIRIQLDNGSFFVTTIQFLPDSTRIDISPAMPGIASPGNLVIGFATFGAPGYTPSLDFTDHRNSMYVPCINP